MTKRILGIFMVFYSNLAFAGEVFFGNHHTKLPLMQSIINGKKSSLHKKMLDKTLVEDWEGLKDPGCVRKFFADNDRVRNRLASGLDIGYIVSSIETGSTYNTLRVEAYDNDDHDNFIGTARCKLK